MTTCRYSLALSVSLFAACGVSAVDEGVAVTGDNPLGIASVTTDHGQDGDAFALHALDAAGVEVASVRRRDTDVGADLFVTAGGVTTTIQTYSGDKAMLTPGGVPDIEALVNITEVDRALSKGHVFVVRPAAKTDETAYTTWGCSASETFTPTGTAGYTTAGYRPIARACCDFYWYYYDWDSQTSYSYAGQYFIPDRGAQMGNATFRQQGTPCTTANGYACTSGKSPSQGGDCYYGPNGWAIVSNAAPQQGYTMKIVSNWDGFDSSCIYTIQNLTSTYGDVQGSSSPGTCPTGTTAMAGGWEGAY